MTAVFIDSTVPLFALGKEHPFRERCLHIFELAALGALQLHASVEMIQEVVFHRMRMTNRASAVIEGRWLSEICELHEFDQDIVRDMLTLVESHGVRGRDAIHVASARRAGFSEIVSSDSDFDSLEIIRRVDPSTYSQ